MNIAISASCQIGFNLFIKKYNVKKISTQLGFGVDQSKQITDLQVNCLNDPQNPSSQYTVSFKLQGKDSDIGLYLNEINTVEGLTLDFKKEAESLTQQMLESYLEQFINVVSVRLTEAKKEQEIQSIVFVGNRFSLNNQTIFKVLSDDGDGKLAIEIEGETTAEDLKLSSHGLMDGLYMGSIKLVNG